MGLPLHVMRLCKKTSWDVYKDRYIEKNTFKIKNVYNGQ